MAEEGKKPEPAVDPRADNPENALKKKWKAEAAAKKRAMRKSHPVPPPGNTHNTTKLLENGTPTDASCYLYFEGNDERHTTVSGPRMTDKTTALAESMTKEEFEAFQRDKVDHLTEAFMAQIRHALLSQNETGDFVAHRISPAVLTDDWVLRATEFVKVICERPLDLEGGSKTTIYMEMTDRKKGFFYEGWLNLKVLHCSLPLVMFTKKEHDVMLRDCLDKIMAAVQPILTGVFPHCAIAPLPTTLQLWEEAARIKAKQARTTRLVADTHIGDALNRIQVLKAEGASGAKIKAEMERVRAQRRGKYRKGKALVETDTDKKKDLPEEVKKRKEEPEITKKDLVKKDSGETSKYKKRRLLDTVLAYRQAPRYWDTPKGDGVTWWVWKGLLSSIVVYYIYDWMRGTAPGVH